VTVDLEQQTISARSQVIGFEIDPYIRWRLLEGWDDISLTLRHADEISNFEAGRPAFAPVTG
jgi:3-isopropylmalate/(R)-2-methylmalate dehydratase small subunit